MERRINSVEQQSMRIVSAFTMMQDLSAVGITIVEMIDKNHEPLPASENSVKRLFYTSSHLRVR